MSFKINTQHTLRERRSQRLSLSTVAHRERKRGATWARALFLTFAREILYRERSRFCYDIYNLNSRHAIYDPSCAPARTMVDDCSPNYVRDGVSPNELSLSLSRATKLDRETEAPAIRRRGKKTSHTSMGTTYSPRIHQKSTSIRRQSPSIRLRSHPIRL